MNLHRLVSRAVGSVNPTATVTILKSTGTTKNPDMTRTPSYAPPITMQAQIQSLTSKDLQQLGGVNIQGELRAVYLTGSWEGVVRPDGRGGDIITFPNGTVWLVVQVLEDWGDTEGWVKVAVTRQNGS